MSKKIEPKVSSEIPIKEESKKETSSDKAIAVKSEEGKKKLSMAIEKLIDSDKVLKKDIPEKYKVAIKEIYKHIHYVDQELNSEHQFNDEIIINFIKNISSVGESLLHLHSDAKTDGLNLINLGDHKIMKKLDFGWLCVHALNVDVAPGILRDSVIEPWNKTILEKVLGKGDNFINIGANFGYFTMLAASLVGPEGKVISFEANPMIYECLAYGIFYSGYPTIIDAHNIAVSDKEDLVKLYFSPIFSGGGSIINNVNYDGYPSMNTIDQCRIGKSHDTNKHLINGDWKKHSMINSYIKSIALDSIIEQHYNNLDNIRMIQIDVEGAEKFVLDGSMHTIEKHEPVILVEFDPHTVKDQVKEMDKSAVFRTFELIGEMGYSFYKVQTNNKFEFQSIAIPQDLESLPHCDIFCVPAKEEALTKIMNIV